MAKKIFSLLFLVLTVSCLDNVDDNTFDCALFDPAFPVITITYLDDQGNNLIRNGTLNPDDISVLFSDGSVGGTVILPGANEENSDNNVLDYTVSIALPRSESESYTIQLNDETMDELQLMASRQDLPCNISYFIPTNATYNGVNTTLVEDGIDFRIRIVL